MIHNSIHVPVLLKEVIEVLKPQAGEFFIDGTLGSGGHAVEIFKRVMPTGKLLGIDLDKNNLEITRLKISTELRIKNLELRNDLILIQGNYADLPEILKKIRKADPSIPLRASGLLLDLGMSSEQLEHSGRGFSFSRNEILDMRFNPKSGNPAAEVVNSFSEKELADIFYKYGEERFSRRIAKKIVEERRKKRILTTFDLVEAIKRAVPKSYEKGRIHPTTRVFQALRIYVNDELGNLEKLLKNLDKIVRMGAFALPKPQAEARYSHAKGRVAIISFHSLEDRLVKNYFRETVKQGKAEFFPPKADQPRAETKKPITATMEEIKKNPRARSAKMRAISFA